MEGIRILRLDNPIEIFREVRDVLTHKVQSDGILSADEIIDAAISVVLRIEDVPSWLKMSTQIASFILKSNVLDLNIDWSTELTAEEIDRISRMIIWVLQMITFGI